MKILIHKSKSVLSCLVVLSVLGAGCKKSGTAAATASGSSGGSVALTAAQVAGTHTAPCVAASSGDYGSLLNGYSFLKLLDLSANSTYVLTVEIYAGTTCQTGPYEIAAYTQFGTYALGSLTDSGATEILYTSASTELSVFGGTSGGGSSGEGDAWVANFNNGCPGIGSPFTTGGESSSTGVDGHTCNTNGMGLPEFPSDGSEFYDLITLDSVSSPTTFTVYQSASIFQMGQFSTFPTTNTFTYSF